MVERFEFRRKYEMLIIGILNCMLGLISSTLKLMPLWVSLGWFLIGAVWIFRYRASQKHGYLQITNTHVNVNSLGFKGVKRICKNEIDKIVFKNRLYEIHYLGKRKIRIYRANLPEESIPLVEDAFNLINNGTPSTGTWSYKE